MADDLLRTLAFELQHCKFSIQLNELTFWQFKYSHGLSEGCPCGIIVTEFELQLHYYIHFQINTLGKGMNPLILPAMG